MTVTENVISRRRIKAPGISGVLLGRCSFVLVKYECYAGTVSFLDLIADPFDSDDPADELGGEGGA